MFPYKSLIKVSCPHCGKTFEHFVKAKLPRTNRQNKYYWGVVLPLSGEHFGYYPDEMHEAFKLLFLRRNEDGRPETLKSTSSLTTKEFVEYVDRCRHWAAEHGIYIPDAE